MDLPELEALFKRYTEVIFFRLPEYKTILHHPLCSIDNLFEKEDGQNTKFIDLESITYFLNISPATSKELDDFLVAKVRGNNKTTIGTKLEELLQRGIAISHIVESTEKYGGNTEGSVWREYIKAEIYEVERRG